MKGLAAASGTDVRFWPSYVDLMTSLFAVTLVLFVLAYSSLSRERDRVQIDADKHRRLQEIEAALRGLQDGEYFEYQPILKRHVLKKAVRFRTGDDTIDPVHFNDLREAGRRIVMLLEGLNKKEKGIKYVLIIEGMASRDQYIDNFRLSYQRALALYRFWEGQNIVFDPDVCEIIIAGSGTAGLGRSQLEIENQRFLIQILPKVGA